MNAATLAAPMHFSGVGLHTGAPATMTVHPAPAGTGIYFEVDGVKIPATAEFASESPLATVLACDGKTVSTVEHVLSALLAFGISEAAIELDGPEVPILDGSARPYVDAIEEVGVQELDARRPVFTLDEPVELRDGNRAIIVLPSSEFRVRVVSDFPHPIGAQYFDTAVTQAKYRDDVAPARTFAFLSDVEAMRAKGLAQGGSLDNALVFDEDGPMRPMQWPNEVVRHKVLDLIGDFSLLGKWPLCEVIAIKSGHALHTRLTRELRKRG
jgi:UDP-3-O-[3-hydroxymyristoyl] N-acetylglucosamine deacetylase